VNLADPSRVKSPMTPLLLLALFFIQDDKTTKLIDALGGDDLELRETAEAELVRIGRPAMAVVRKALGTAQGESKARLERVVKLLSEPRWMTDVAKAREVAAKEKKPLLVFTSIGDLDGAL